MSKSDVFSTPFAESIYRQKYSMNQSETWADTAKRVTEAVCNQLLDSKTKEKIYQLILERKFIPGGRYLYSSGRSFHQVNNCFDGETRILTDKGAFAFKDIVNEKVNVRNWKGEWEEAQVKSFGKQELLKLTLSNGEEILTTANHLWIQPDGNRVKTTELKKVMLSEVKEMPSMDPEGIRHGIIYGDGYKHPNTGYTEIVIVNPKKDEHLVSYFENKEVEIILHLTVKEEDIELSSDESTIDLDKLPTATSLSWSDSDSEDEIGEIMKEVMEIETLPYKKLIKKPTKK